MADTNLLKPVALFEQLFESKGRLDNRELLEPGVIHVSAGVLPSCHGSSLVRIGQTHIICGVRTKVLPEQINAGRIVCNVEINGLANRSSHPKSSVSKEAQCLSSKLQQLVETVVCSDVTSQLNIFSDSDQMSQPVASYILKLDVIVLHDDGCLLDACVPAALTALKQARWPKLIALSVDHRTTSCLEQYAPSPSGDFMSLRLIELPIPVTWCFLPTRVSKPDRPLVAPMILQPTRRELALWDADAGVGQIILSASGRVLDLSMVHAFLPGLFGNLSTPHTEQPDSITVWQTLYNSAMQYVKTMLDAISSAVKT
ncbi:Exosome complex component RRP43 [Clonorchis sinensis]|uniref:Ribosomal RNA-processing protein 42 n=1 Tax=Clonorchis sinensis TaxID=79923 RepID=A0A3R7C5E2_CLOSI|nr:Exosome complex component RRP43 [Clonorchis sinensis]